MRRPSPIRGRLAALVVAAAVPLALWAGLPGSSDASRLDNAQSQLDQARSREQSLSSAVAQLSRIIDQLDGDIAILQRRQAQVQAELDRARAQLERTQIALRRERAHLAELRRRLAYSRQVLARRLVQIYESGRPDVITVVLDSRGFADLLERTEFLRRINDQDKQIIDAVRRARDATHRVTVRLAALEARQQRIAAAVEAQRNALASMEQALNVKRASLAGPLTKSIIFIVVTALATAILALSIASTGPNGTVGYNALFTDVTLNAGQGNDTIAVQSTNVIATTTVNANAGQPAASALCTSFSVTSQREVG